MRAEDNSEGKPQGCGDEDGSIQKSSVPARGEKSLSRLSSPRLKAAINTGCSKRLSSKAAASEEARRNLFF